MTTNKRVVLLRHAQSQWNLEKRFTGWADSALTDTGREEARRAGRLLKARGYRFDRAFTSVLQRATETLETVLRELGQEDLPVEQSWRLNERHYGAVEGLNKTEFAETYGKDKLHRLRRGYADRPEPMAPDDPRFLRHKTNYPDLAPGLLPASESLADTLARLLPYWIGTIAPAIRRGDHVLIVSHGNTLRALLKYLENMSDSEVEKLEIPIGRPLIAVFKPDGSYLRREDPDTPEAAGSTKVSE